MALKKNLIANYLGQGWSALMSILFIPLYIKYLGIEAYGLIGLFAVLVAWLRLLDMGMTPTLVREMSRFAAGAQDAEKARDLLRSIEWVTVVLALIVAVAIGLSAHWLASSWLKAGDLPVAEVSKAFVVMGVVTALRFVESVYRSCLVGLQRQVLFNLVNSGMATLRGVGAIALLAWVSPTIQAFFLWQCFVSFVSVVIMGVASYGSFAKASRSGQFSLEVLTGVWKFTGGMIGINLLALLLTQVDKILLSKLLDLSEFGYYTLAAAVASAVYMFVSPITQAFYPRLSQLHASSDQNGLIRTYHLGAQLVAVMLGSASVVLICFSDVFLQLWTQDATLSHRSAPLLSLLVLGNLFHGLMWIPYQTQLAHGWTSLSIRINTVAVIVVVPALMVVIPHFGAIGAAAIWCCLNAVNLLVGAHYMSRRILRTEKWRWYTEDVLQPLLAAIFVVAFSRYALPNPENVIERAIFLVIVSSMTLAAAAGNASHIRKKIRHLSRSWVLSPKSFS